MYARIASFEADSAHAAEAIVSARQQVESDWSSPPRGLEGAKEVYLLLDRKNWRGLGITLYESTEALERGHEALNQMASPTPLVGRRTGVSIYEVVVHKQR